MLNVLGPLRHVAAPPPKKGEAVGKLPAVIAVGVVFGLRLLDVVGVEPGFFLRRIRDDVDDRIMEIRSKIGENLRYREDGAPVGGTCIRGGRAVEIPWGDLESDRDTSFVDLREQGGYGEDVFVQVVIRRQRDGGLGELGMPIDIGG